MIRLVDTAQPGVRSDDRLIREINQSGGVITYHMANRSILLRQRGGFDPCRIVAGRVLLEKLLAVDAVRIPFHCDRPLAQMRQYGSSDALVVLHKFPLGDPIIGKENLLRVCYFHGPATGSGGIFRFRTHNGRSRTTSRAFLSWRKPRKRGRRNRPSRVHSVKLTCAPTFRLTQCTPLPALTSSANGEPSISWEERSLANRTSTFQSNPVPTFPA